MGDTYNKRMLMIRKGAILRTHEKLETSLRTGTVFHVSFFIYASSDENYIFSLEYLDCRQSLFAVQQGKCAISGKEFKSVEEIACCLKVSRNNGGKEQYRNMVLVNKKYQPLIQGRKKDIPQYLEAVKPDKKQLDKINRLRQKNGMSVVG